MDHDRTPRLLERILGEYREMPGLRLSTGQAARLLGLEEEHCRVLLETLVAAGRLARTPRGEYCSCADAEWSLQAPPTPSRRTPAT